MGMEGMHCGVTERVLAAPLVLRAMRAYLRHAPVSFGKTALGSRVLNRRLKLRPIATTACTRSGIILSVVTSDVIQRYLYLFGVWEPRLTSWIRRRFAAGDAFVDVGANIGYYSTLASQLVGPSGRVVAIEASPSSYQSLRMNVERNGCSNVRTVNVAASHVAGRMTLYLERSTNLGRTSVVAPSTVEVSFETDALPLSCYSPVRSCREPASSR
jgi:hypothetical protein